MTQGFHSSLADGDPSNHDQPWLEDFTHWSANEDDPHLHGYLPPPAGWRQHSVTRNLRSVVRSPVGAADDGAPHEQDILPVLADAAHHIGPPVAAEWQIDADGDALAPQLLLPGWAGRTP